MIKKLITLLAIVIANQQPSVAQPIPSGEYVSNFGSEDYWVRVVDGRITSAEGSTRHSPPVSQFQILDFNSLIPAIKVKTHQNHIWSLCLVSTAPSWGRYWRIAYCDFDKGWTERSHRIQHD